MTVYVVQWVCAEVIAVCVSLGQAKRFCSKRDPQLGVWVEHNAHGHWWAPSHNHNYAITEMKVLEESMKTKCVLCGLEMELDTGDTPVGEEAPEALAEAAGVSIESPLCYVCVSKVVAKARAKLAAADAAFRDELMAHCPGELTLPKLQAELREAQDAMLALEPWSAR